jgi:hypothetical protein
VGLCYEEIHERRFFVGLSARISIHGLALKPRLLIITFREIPSAIDTTAAEGIVFI